VKKTIAALSASVLGIGGAVAAAAAPALAVAPKCTESLQHEVNPSVSPTDSWYMECIPQYGMGKAEFTITTDSTHRFPAGYSLDDGHQSVTSSPTAAQVKAYFQAEASEESLAATYTGAFVNLTEASTDSTTTSQVYGIDDSTPFGATVAYPIESVGLATGELPADCTPSGSGATYEGEYKVVFGTTTTHFTQVIDSVAHSVTVAYTPPPLYLGLNFDSSSAFGFDESKPLCASSGALTNFAADYDPSGPDDGFDWASIALNATTLPPTLETLSPADGPITDLSDADSFFAATVTNFGSFATTSTPVLATTGTDPRPAGTLGAGLLSVGILAMIVGVVRRRRRSILDPH
jgi:hypothetical protein